MPNYGDCALGLPPTWDRSVYETQEWLLTTVGHENGVADARLKNEPEKEHQFRWADPNDQFNRDLMLAYRRGYEFVHKDTWDKRDGLWGWDALDRVTYGGLVLMARPKEMWLAEQARRAAINAKSRREIEHDVDETPEGLSSTEMPMARRRGRPPGPRAHAAM